MSDKNDSPEPEVRWVPPLRWVPIPVQLEVMAHRAPGAKWHWEFKHLPPTYAVELYAKECTISIVPRPNYCDRGKFEAHVLDPGFPNNPNPTDAADIFPRLYFSLTRAMQEMEAWMEARNYRPGTVDDRERHDG